MCFFFVTRQISAERVYRPCIYFDESTDTIFLGLTRAQEKRKHFVSNHLLNVGIFLSFFSSSLPVPHTLHMLARCPLIRLTIYLRIIRTPTGRRVCLFRFVRAPVSAIKLNAPSSPLTVRLVRAVAKTSFFFPKFFFHVSVFLMSHPIGFRIITVRRVSLLCVYDSAGRRVRRYTLVAENIAYFFNIFFFRF